MMIFQKFSFYDPIAKDIRSDASFERICNLAMNISQCTHHVINIDGITPDDVQYHLSEYYKGKEIWRNSLITILEIE